MLRRNAVKRSLRNAVANVGNADMRANIAEVYAVSIIRVIVKIRRMDERLPRRRLKHGVPIGDDGRIWCSGGSKSGNKARPPVKRRYHSADEAWLAAFTEFHRLGAILTPYYCTAARRVEAWMTITPHPNPWAFTPYLVKRGTKMRRQRVTCDGWHLARNVYELGR